MTKTDPDLRPAYRTRARGLDLVFDDAGPVTFPPFSLEWLFDHVEGRTETRAAREGGSC
jgi:hypothetical protein